MNQRGFQHLPIIIALFFGAAVVVTIFGYMLWPKDEEIGSNSTVMLNSNSFNGAINSSANPSSTTDSGTDSTTNTATRTNPNSANVQDFNVTVLESGTNLPIVNTSIVVYSDNGVRCVTEPCSTDGRSWTGTTNNQGVVTLPASMMDASVTFTVPGYRGGNLKVFGKLQADGSWILAIEKSKL